MNILYVLILAAVQGICELLPVSSSAHVILAEKWLGLDPTSPQMTMLLVMLHTGTMFAVIVYFWTTWRETYFSSVPELRRHGLHVVWATAATGVVGLGLLALRWLSRWLEQDRWHLFGIYCLLAAVAIFWLG